MKDLSFLFLNHKSKFGGRMRKSMRNFCNGDGSTSTLDNQHNLINPLNSSIDDNNDIAVIHSPVKQSTLEEMILQLELEEEISRKCKNNKLNDELVAMRGRMSCANISSNSDILRSARNALNQYPRFSLDGRDAMYRSSFRTSNQLLLPGRKSVCCDRGVLARERLILTHSSRSNNDDPMAMRSCNLPTKLGGESVVWCKPGVIPKLMGLEAMPVPVLHLASSRSNKDHQSKQLGSIIKRQNLRRRVERHEMERRDMNMMRMRMASNYSSSSSSSSRKNINAAAGGYCVMKPVEPLSNDQLGGWPTRRFQTKNIQLQ